MRVSEAVWAFALVVITLSSRVQDVLGEEGQSAIKNFVRTIEDPRAQTSCLDEEDSCTDDPNGCCEGLVCSGLPSSKTCVEPPVCLSQWHDCSGGSTPCCDDMACTISDENGNFECQPRTIGSKTASFTLDGHILEDVKPLARAVVRNTRKTKSRGLAANTNIACSTGDPHIYTFDGLKYDCHGEGEFILVKSYYTAREIQVRYEHMSDNRALSVGKAVAIRDEGDTPIVQISIASLSSSLGYDMGDEDGCGKVQFFVDGFQRDLRDGSGQDDKVIVTVKDKDIWVKYVESEMQVKVRYHRCRLNVCVHLPDTDNTVGVLGTANGDVQDDWTTLEGTILDVPDSLLDRLRKPGYDFCTQNFCIRDKEKSLFTYKEDGFDFDYYQKCDLPYGTTIERYLSDIPQNAINICEGELQCIMDVQNGDQEDAMAMHAALEEYATMCNPPGGECDESECCTGQCVDRGGLAGKICDGQMTCTPEFGSCKELGCCEGLTCKSLDDGNSICLDERECMDEWMGCDAIECCEGMVCLPNQNGDKQCRRLHQCTEKYDDCSMVGCCGELKCGDNGIGGKWCDDVPDCYDTQDKDCSAVPCCECLTCVEENGRSLCKKLPKSVGLGESCKWVPCHEDDKFPLECVDIVDEKGRQDKQCRLVPGDAEILVFDDINSNGLQDFGEPGIAGVKLRLIRDKDLRNLTDPGHGGNCHRELTSDNDGKVRFTRVPRGIPLRAKVIQPPPGAVRTLNNQGEDDAMDSDLLDDGTCNPFRLKEEDVWTKTALGYRMPVDLEIRVFYDLDGDGVQNEGEPGIQGVDIRLIHSANGTNVPEQGNGGSAHEELTTDKNGFVTFTKVPQNVNIRAKVTGAPKGAIPTKGKALGDKSIDSDLRSDGTSYDFKIKEGRVHSTIDLGYLMPETVMVRVWNDVNSNGRVDNGETGVKGVELRLVYDKNKTYLPNFDNGGNAHEEVMTDDEGMANFTLAPLGESIRVKVTGPPMGAVATYETAVDDNKTDSSLGSDGLSRPFRLLGDGAPLIGLGYKMPGSVVVRVWDDANSNGLQDDLEQGIQGVGLRLIQDQDGETLVNQGNGGNAHSELTTDTNGYVTFNKVPREMWLRVNVTNAPEGALPTLHNAGDDAEKDSDLGSNGLSDRFAVTDETLREIDFGYRMPSEVKVRVWDDKNRNGVQDDTELGIKGVKLRLIRDKDHSYYEGECQAEDNLPSQNDGGQKCKICHVANGKTLEIGCSAVPAHLAHGDYEGECGEDKCNVCHVANGETLEIGCSAVPAHLTHGDYEGECGEDKCKVCHVANGKTLEIGCSAVPAHLAHGDYEGECEDRNLGQDKCKVCHVANGKTLEIGCSAVPAHLAHGDYEGECSDPTVQVIGGNCHNEITTDSDGIATFTKVPKGTTFRVKVLNKPKGVIRAVQNKGGDKHSDSDLGDNGLSDAFRLANFTGTVFDEIDLGYIMPENVEVRVWDDINANGIQDTHELGITGVRLRLIKAKDNTNVDDQENGGNAHEELTTNADGLVVFEKVPVGEQLRVKVTNAPQGAVRTEINKGNDDTADSDLRSDGTTVSFDLRSFTGDVFDRIDIGYRMPSDMKVRVWDDIDGNGVQDEGEPGIQGVKLRLINAKDKENLVNIGGGSNCHAELATDESGVVTFHKVPKGLDLRVKVTNAPVGAIRTRHNRGGNDEADSDLGADMMTDTFSLNSFVDSGAYGSIDLGFQMPKTMIVRVWNDKNQNGVQDDEEDGIQGVKLRLIKDEGRDNLPDQGNGGSAHEEITTDAFGKAKFSKVPLGIRLRIKVTQPPPNAKVTRKNAGFDAHLDSEMNPSGVSDSFKLPSDVSELFDAVDVGYYFLSTSAPNGPNNIFEQERPSSSDASI